MTKSRLMFSCQIGICAAGFWLWHPLDTLAKPELDHDNFPPAFPYAVVMPGPSYVNTADLALPNAREIIVDVPSAFHWSRYQSGEANGWRYQMFPDGFAKVMPDTEPHATPFTLSCKAGVSCEILRPDGSRFTVLAIGGPRPEIPAQMSGETLARYLAEWMLAGTGTPPDTTELPAERSPAQEEPQGADTEAAQAVSAPLPDTETSDGSAQGPMTDAAALPDDGIAEPDPVCAEQAPFLPTACAQPTTDLIAPSKRIRASARNLPAPDSLDQTAPAIEPAPETLFERINLACSITGSTSLGVAKSNGSGRSIGKPRASLGCSANLTEKLSLRVSVLKYANSKDRASDDPDFTYALSYRYSDKITFSYASYSAKFGGTDGGFLDSLASGNLRGSYKLPSIPLPNQKRSACSVSVGLPDPTDTSVNLSCGYAVTEKLRIGGTANLYFANAQGNYDPDYSYTASYRPSKDWLISYSNYSNNRWPWNRGPNPGPGVEGGSLSVTYSLQF
jgi:hypothetical protein